MRKAATCFAWLAAAFLSAAACAQGGGLVATASDRASEIGADILARGGNAMDAAVAVQFALTLLDGPETGIGGGGFLLYRDGASGEITVFDGRETAPAAAGPERFMLAPGVAMPLALAVVSGRSVGVPGMVAMLYDAHRAHGRLNWSELVAPTQRLADTGAVMPERLGRQLREGRGLWLFRAPRRLLAGKDAASLSVPDLARTLGAIAERGPKAFYDGAIADEIVTAAQDRWPFPGDLTRSDLKGYEAKRRAPVCGPYRHWRICGAGPPSSGGIAVVQILGMLERFDLAALPVLAPEAVHLIAEASRLAFADRNAYIGDPDFVDVPVSALTDPDYLARRAALIDPERAMIVVGAGALEGLPPGRAFDGSAEHGTSHLSVVDAGGNAVALTGSIEAPFGSRIAAAGFLLNNQLTDFDFRPTRHGAPAANRVEPGKRPRSSMAPTIVLDEASDIRLVIGSRGGSRIIGYTLKAIVAVLDWEMSVAEAARLPNFLHRGETLELERGTHLEDLAPTLRAMGHEVEITELESGLHGIEIAADGPRGGADPRSGGAVRAAEPVQ